MTRTEQYLRGFDSCRSCIQDLLIQQPELQSIPELMRLAQTPYYEEDGLDWCVDCHDCKNWDTDMDYNYCCILNVDISKIEGKCPKWVQKEVEIKND